MYQWQYFDIGRCCICGQPLSTSCRGNWVPLMKKATWKMPTWIGPRIVSGLGAIANFCDGCREAKEKSGIFGYIKYAVEYRDEQVIYHEVEKLEDLIVKPGHDQEKRG